MSSPTGVIGDFGFSSFMATDKISLGVRIVRIASYPEVDISAVRIVPLCLD